jgi:uroporphyrinogen-III synthase
MAWSLSMPWFSVGAATAQILRDHGLDVHFPADGDDSEALLQLPRCARQRGRRAGADPAREGGRELLAERLREQGASVEYLELYRRDLPAYARILPRRIEAERLNGLVVSSGQGFEHLRPGRRPGRDGAVAVVVPSPRSPSWRTPPGPNSCGLPWRECRGFADGVTGASRARSLMQRMDT